LKPKKPQLTAHSSQLALCIAEAEAGEEEREEGGHWTVGRTADSGLWSSLAHVVTVVVA